MLSVGSRRSGVMAFYDGTIIANHVAEPRRMEKVNEPVT